MTGSRWRTVPIGVYRQMTDAQREAIRTSADRLWGTDYVVAARLPVDVLPRVDAWIAAATAKQAELQERLAAAEERDERRCAVHETGRPVLEYRRRYER